MITINREELLKNKEREKKINKDFKEFWADNRPSTVTINKKIIEYAKKKAEEKDMTLKDYLELLILHDK